MSMFGSRVGKLVADLAEWSRRQFGDDKTSGPANPLADIVNIINSMQRTSDDKPEYYGVLLVWLLDAVRRRGLTVMELVELAESELERLKGLPWPIVQASGPLPSTKGWDQGDPSTLSIAAEEGKRLRSSEQSITQNMPKLGGLGIKQVVPDLNHAPASAAEAAVPVDRTSGLTNSQSDWKNGYRDAKLAISEGHTPESLKARMAGFSQYIAGVVAKCDEAIRARS